MSPDGPVEASLSGRDMPPEADGAYTHVFSVDVEDWYHGIEIPIGEWERYEDRVHRGTDALLSMMERHGVRGTCFVLGRVAEEYPDIVRRIHACGHEVATHGYSHAKVYDLDPEAFREEIRRSKGVLEELTGEPVRGYRAPYFTVTKRSLWALEILVEEGIRYDSSIHPVYNYRYGIPNADRRPGWLDLPSGQRIFEVPVSTFPVGNFNLPVGGGAYLRIWPFLLTRFFLHKLAGRGERVILYVHPWELDPEHPRIDLPLRVSATHYFNLASTESRLRRLFDEFTFVPFRDAFEGELEAVES